MPFFEVPGRVAAAVAFAVRLAIGWAALTSNPLLRNLELDSKYYVQWAREIAAGDIASARGIVAGSPFILNPLYAYVLAPVIRLGEDPARTVILLQAALAAGTAAFAAAAARRLFGRTAAWTAGLGVALSTALVQLDLHVAVSGLAAFLTAGAVYAALPDDPAAPSFRHSPVAKGLWLGLGALARPIAPLALPFFAWDEWKRAAPRRGAAIALLAVAFAATSIPSLFRNRAVTGEWIVSASSSGINLHIGNNASSRKFRTMVSPYTTFRPKEMHEEARLYVIEQKGGDPTPAEVSAYFRDLAVRECVEHPVESALFYANKARWFASPVEPPSTASLANDVRFTPLLRAAFVPTWLLASLAAAGLWFHRRRRDVVCGPGALVIAHLAVLTAVFPLSHYRSPAIPALAVLAGGAIEALVAAWRAGERPVALRLGAIALAVAVAGACPPQPDPGRYADAMLLAHDARRRGETDRALEYTREAMEAYATTSPDAPAFPPAMKLAATVEWEYAVQCADPAERARGLAASIEWLGRALDAEPSDWTARLLRSKVYEDAGDMPHAIEDALRVVEQYPKRPEGQRRLQELRERR